jgi:hypothetical protein
MVSTKPSTNWFSRTRVACTRHFCDLRNEADAGDRAQEAVLKALKYIGQFRGEARFSVWLMQIAVNKARHTQAQRRQVARGSCPTGNGRKQAILRDCSLPYCYLCPTLWSYGGRPQGQKLLCVGIGWHCRISAIHVAGLVTLTHTPSPMGFLNRILGRPPQEKPLLILVVGYQACVPDISKKSSEESLTFL